jgi:RNA polymerase sigma factor (sigma-70 family)
MAGATPHPVLQELRNLVDRPVEQWADEELLARFVAHHDEGAFKVLLLRHGCLVLSVCRRVLGHAQEAEDACQATFLVLARGAAAIRKPASLASWLYGVAYRVAKQARADLKHWRQHQRQVLTMSHEDPLAPLLDSELHEVLEEELGRLPARFRDPLILCCCQGMTLEQAARELHRPLGSMSRWLAAGKERLRQRLAQRGIAVPATVLATHFVQLSADAALAPAFVSTTARAAAQLALGKPLATGLVSAQVLAWTEGVVTAMLKRRLIYLLVPTLMLASLVAGAAVVVLHAQGGNKPNAAPVDSPLATAPPQQLAKTDREQPATAALFDIDYDAHRVIARSVRGGIRWSTALDGYLGLVRPPHLLWDAQRVYVTHQDGVTALDAHTGKVLWHSPGPGNCLFLKGELLLAADGASVHARAVVSGAEVFKVNLPARDFDPSPIAEVAGLFLVQALEKPGGKGVAFLLDRKGQIRHRLDRQVVAGIRQENDLILLTSTDVVRLSPDDKIRWAIPFERHQWLAGGGLAELPGGDLLAFRHGRINDSGVDLIRLKPGAGQVVWKAHCAGLGVAHSEYEHEVRVAIERRTIRVTSRGSQGTFVELLDLRSGRQLERIQS